MGKPYQKSRAQSWIGHQWRMFKKYGELNTIMLPGVVKIFIFSYLPMVGIIIAFKDFRADRGVFGSAWSGFKNFEFFFASDYAFRLIRNTVLYEVGYMLTSTIFGLLFAVLLAELTSRWTKVYHTSLLLPHFLSLVVLFYIVNTFLDVNHGMLNRVLETIGLQGRNWYLEPEPWPYILITVALWKRIGFATLVYYAGIMAINKEYYEAADIDGASRWQKATHITLPFLAPLVSILIILSIGGMMSGDFGLHYFVPNNSGMTFPTTDIIDTFVYRALTTLGNVSMASAVSVFQSVVGLVLVLIANYTTRYINEENSLW